MKASSEGLPKRIAPCRSTHKRSKWLAVDLAQKRVYLRATSQDPPLLRTSSLTSLTSSTRSPYKGTSVLYMAEREAQNLPRITSEWTKVDTVLSYGILVEKTSVSAI